MRSIDRQRMIDALLLDDLRIIKDDLINHDDPTYLTFLLETRVPYQQWSDSEIEEAYLGLDL